MWKLKGHSSSSPLTRIQCLNLDSGASDLFSLFSLYLMLPGLFGKAKDQIQFLIELSPFSEVESAEGEGRDRKEL